MVFYFGVQTLYKRGFEKGIWRWQVWKNTHLEAFYEFLKKNEKKKKEKEEEEEERKKERKTCFKKKDSHWSNFLSLESTSLRGLSHLVYY